MDILSKFTSVEVKSIQRISEADQHYCNALQAAYEAAKVTLSELNRFWEAALQSQKQLLAGTDKKCTLFLTDYDRLSISLEKIQSQSQMIHTIFILQLVAFFNRAYNISIDSLDISEKLLPQEPKYRYSHEKKEEHYIKEHEKYEESLRTLSLTADQIVEEIFSQMDGRGLTEQALYELKSKCHDAAWSHYEKAPRYELHKDTLRFNEYACSHSGYSSAPWQLCDGLKNVMRGIAHFETDTFSYIPDEIGRLLGYSYQYDITTFSNCKKIKQLKMFKNGRVDIKFTDADFAKRFMEDYLGTVY